MKMLAEHKAIHTSARRVKVKEEYLLMKCLMELKERGSEAC